MAAGIIRRRPSDLRSGKFPNYELSMANSNEKNKVENKIKGLH